MATEKIWTPVFRAAFADVFTPKSYQGKEPKYALTMLFDPEKSDLDEMKEIAESALLDRFGKKLTAKKNGLKRPFLDGDEKDWDGFEGMIYVRTTSKFPPGVVARDGKTAILDGQGFYAGCYARATVNTFTYDKEGNKGVAFGIQNIQFVQDGDPFSGATSAEEDFDELPDDGEAASGDDTPFDK